jgi:hypothetical protein
MSAICKDQKETVEHILQRGWKCTDKERRELYDTIINDLAEGIEIPNRLTRSNLIETIGYLMGLQSDLNNRFQHLRDEIVVKSLKLANEAVIAAAESTIPEV